MKIKVILILLFFILSNCGYQPLYSTKNINFTLSKINIYGPEKIKNGIKNNLKIFLNQKNKSKTYDINVKSTSAKSVISKDSEGNPNIFSLKLQINLEILENEKIISTKNFIETFDYKNQSNLFDLKKYEDNILDNLAEKIYEKMILYLYTI
tara:strand:+ start:393 stop:848 length:456 start_codon:yes stop_codon:yes gene_type:complete